MLLTRGSPLTHRPRVARLSLRPRLRQATGLGIFYGIEDFLADEPTVTRCGWTAAGVAGKAYIIQGFGNVGSM